MKVFLAASLALLSSTVAFAGDYSCRNEYQSPVPLTLEASVPRFVGLFGKIKNVNYSYQINGKTFRGKASCDSETGMNGSVCTPSDSNSAINRIIFHNVLGLSYEIKGVSQLQFMKCDKV
jgi:hypothetical protein